LPPPIIRDNNQVKFFGYPQYFSDNNNSNIKEEGLNNDYFNDNKNYEGWSFVQNA
jgi:hypothetical protein